VTTAIWWIRRDLRLADNQALHAAIAAADQLIPVFVLDPTILKSEQVGDAAWRRVAFLFGGLRLLDAELRARGSRLVILQGNPTEELAKLASETGATAVFAEEDPWPYARSRDAAVATALRLHLVAGLTVHPPDAVLKADGTPYTVFTPFLRAWKSRPLPVPGGLLEPPSVPPVPQQVASLPLHAERELPPNALFVPGEAEAQRRLGIFLADHDLGIYHYAENRDRPDMEGTSQLSPYLRFGMLSARQVIVGALRKADDAPDEQDRHGADTWLNELVWREFYISIQAHFPETADHSFRRDLQAIAWENDEAAFEAWCAGQTGYPIVDAAMRQLWQTGWMHNRARMIVASFLVKDLLIDWRWGERWFMQHLLDADPSSNNGGWQWSAGTGTDATPYFRIFNPILQGRKHDPEGVYVRSWVPELAHVPLRYLHAPWEMPTDLQAAIGCRVGHDYPFPVVDHGWARERVLAAYARSRSAG